MPLSGEAKREYQRNWLKKRRLDWLNVNGPCVKCGSSKDLELDHIEQDNKISHRIWGWSESRRLKELKKCQVLCRECHLKKTKNQLTKPLVHGTVHGYEMGGCRCTLCTKAKIDRVNEWRWKTGKRKKRIGQ